MQLFEFLWQIRNDRYGEDSGDHKEFNGDEWYWS